MADENDLDRSLTVADDVLAERLEVVRTAIANVGRDDVQVVGVTKGFDASAVRAAKRVGLSEIGENYAQELIEKSSDFDDGVTVNFLGRVQRNKVRKVHHLVDVWQSVARPEILTEIAKRSDTATVLLQVQPDGDTTKDGVRPPQLAELFALAADLNISVAGLMTIGVLNDADATRKSFAELVALADEYDVPVRSMGMSGDYQEALAAGSTMLRLGSALFGNRPGY